MKQIMGHLKKSSPREAMLPMQIVIRGIRKQIKEKAYGQAERALKKIEESLDAEKVVHSRDEETTSSSDGEILE